MTSSDQPSAVGSDDETIPNPETGVGIGTDTEAEPNTFEPEEDSQPDPA